MSSVLESAAVAAIFAADMRISQASHAKDIPEINREIQGWKFERDYVIELLVSGDENNLRSLLDMLQNSYWEAYGV